MKLRLVNYISTVCFFLSSATLLFIPLLNLDHGFSNFAYCLAGLFWIFLLLGMALQVFLHIKTRKMTSRKLLKSQKIFIVGVLVVSVIMLFFVLAFLKENPVALPINLFALLISIESYSVIRRMEKLL